jgi:DNA-binding NtrC family response regulator
VFALRGGECVVGSGRDADIVVDDPAVSRRHVQLQLAPEGVQVLDLCSSNGTFYLGQRVENMILGLGSRIRIGASEIVIAPDPESLLAGAPQEGPGGEYRGLTGDSPAMRRLFAVLTRLEGSLAHVLIEGESGVGKELVVDAIRQGSVLANRPFLSVNCGAIGRELVLTELFGHRKGSFTGAVSNRRGAFDEANEGTLFLDEIGELPLDVQPALLRALELGEVRPIGEAQAHRVKVRVLAATNRDLEAEAREGRFRQDLYYRLAVVKVRVPPLRDRIEDIPLLARRIAAGEGVHELPESFVSSLTARTWPGNVRELRNAIQSFLALGEAELVPATYDPLVAAMGRVIDPKAPYTEQKDAVVAVFTRLYVRALMAENGGNQTEAARIAGLDRGYFGRLVARHGGGKKPAG